MRRIFSVILVFIFISQMFYIYSDCSPGFFAALETVEPSPLNNDFSDYQGLVFKLDEKSMTAELKEPFDKGSFTLQNVVIPLQVKKDNNVYTVTGIGSSSLDGLNCIKSIVIPSSVKSIGSYAFDGCEGLTLLDIPEGTVSVGDFAFAYCDQLINVSIPSTLEKIGTGAFAYCYSLRNFSVSPFNNFFANDSSGVLYSKDKTVLLQFPYSGSAVNYTAPAGVKEIGAYAFYKNISLKSVSLPASISNINDFAFSGCSLLVSVSFLDGIKNIGNYSFENCSSLKNVHLPSSATRIGTGAFKSCSSMTNFVAVNGLSVIDASAFEGCTLLSGISLPDSVISIGRKAFYNTAWWSSVPDGVVYIGKAAYGYKGKMPADAVISVKDGTKAVADYAFYSFENFTSFFIPSSVVNIGYGAFFYCESLSSIKVAVENKFYCSDENGILYSKDKSSLVVFPSGSFLNSYVIPSGVKTVLPRAFYYCTRLKTITFKKGIESIGKSAFEGCSSLNNVYFSSGTLSIGEYAFYDCSSLSEVTLPASVQDIGSDAFFNCNNVVLNVFERSPAYVYAIENEIKYKLLTDYNIVLSSGYATGIKDRQSVSDITAKLSGAVIKNASGIVLNSNSLVGTGCIITYASNNYTVIVKGDVDGSGYLDSRDYLLTKRAFLGTYKLSEAQKKACCFSGTLLPTSGDFLKIKRHFLGSYDLFE